MLRPIRLLFAVLALGAPLALGSLPAAAQSGRPEVNEPSATRPQAHRATRHRAHRATPVRRHVTHRRAHRATTAG